MSDYVDTRQIERSIEAFVYWFVRGHFCFQIFRVASHWAWWYIYGVFHRIADYYVWGGVI